MSRKKSKQKRTIRRSISEKIAPLLVIFVMVFYPLLLPLRTIWAQEEVAVTIEPPAKEEDPEKVEAPTPKPEPEPEKVEPRPAEETPKESVDTAKTESPAEEPKEASPEPVKEEVVPEKQTEPTETEKEETPTEANAPTEDMTGSEQPVVEEAPAVSNDAEATNTDEENSGENPPIVNDETQENNDGDEQEGSETACCETGGECCPETIIENDNDAEIINTENSLSDTGNNMIGQPQEPAADQSTENVPSDSNADTDEPTDSQSEEATEDEELSEQPETNTPSNENGIASGDAISETAIVNEINTNIVSENYIDSVINITGNETSNINLLDQFEGLLASAQQLNSANIEALTIKNNNVANVENTVSSAANSGVNTIQESVDSPEASPIESAQIATGQADAAADVVNIINSNLIGNTWIFSVINIFGNWVGDLILPGEGLLQTPNSQVATNLEVVNENDASIINNVDANANSGENSIADAQNSLIVTGDAISSSDAKTIANTNIIQNNWFVLLVNNLGSWSGKILGAEDENSSSYEYNFETDNKEDLLTSIYSFLSVHNSNQATVTNDVNASATTGNNSIAGQVENASIITGDASARANVVNIVNTNIIGNNWIFAIVNVMGSWTGNAVLAYPDLAISISDGIAQADSGSMLTYQVSYENLGQADCNDAKIEIHIPNTLAYQDGGEKNSTRILSLGKIMAGEKNSTTFTVVANDDGNTSVANVSAEISTSTKETELSNNSASDETTILVKQIITPVIPGNLPENIEGNLLGNEIVEFDPDSNLKISRPTKQDLSVPTGNIIEQSIYVENKGEDQLNNIIVTEAIKNPANEIIGKYSWPIPILNTHEKVMITYQILINNNAATGTYTYRARGIALNSIGEKVVSNKASSNLAVFAMHYNNQATEQPIPAIIQEDIGNVISERVLGDSSVNPNSMPLWLLLLLIIAVLAGMAATWILIQKRISRKMSFAEEEFRE